MRTIAAIIVCLSLLALAGAKSVNAVPPPCSSQQLKESSGYAVEGNVTGVECGEPYDSDQCRPAENMKGEFVSELLADCTASVAVTKSIKGEYKPGDSVNIAFTKIARTCLNGTHIIPGRPTSDLKVGMVIRYYDSQLCRYSNTDILTLPTPGPDEDS